MAGTPADITEAADIMDPVDITGPAEVEGPAGITATSSVKAGLATPGGSAVSANVEQVPASLALAVDRGGLLLLSRAVALALAPRDLAGAL